jgi:hypothetical protein
MERLFSMDGLGLTIIRGQIYPNFNYTRQTFRKLLKNSFDQDNLDRR